MLDLKFAIEGAEMTPFAATPTIGFRTRISRPVETPPIKNIALRAQIMIEAARRRYSPNEREEMRDLFGEPERWSKTLRSLLWTHVSLPVGSFEKSLVLDLPVPCSFDFNVGAAKYFLAAKDEDVPLCFQFSGTVFYLGAGGAVQIEQIGWDQEARFALSAQVWREMMEHYYPNSTWLRLQHQAFERLREYKSRHGIATWEDAIESLLAFEKETVA